MVVRGGLEGHRPSVIKELNTYASGRMRVYRARLILIRAGLESRDVENWLEHTTGRATSVEVAQK